MKKTIQERLAAMPKAEKAKRMFLIKKKAKQELEKKEKLNNSKDTNQNMSDDKKKENEYIHPLVKRYYSNKAWMDIGWDYPTKDEMEEYDAMVQRTIRNQSRILVGIIVGGLVLLCILAS
jgi:hypothetical protein